MIQIDGCRLTMDDIVRVARFGEKVGIHPDGQKALEESHQRLQQILLTGKPVYGINTGFGIFADRSIPNSDSAKLSRNLILSHAVGAGSDLPADVVRGAMLVRANTLVKGFSGVRPVVVETLLEMLNRGVTPVVPSQGSLGSSGDLCMLSHMALVFTTDANDGEEDSGFANYQGRKMSGKAAMEAAGIPRIVLGPKEGLAINNGATFAAAIAALTLHDAWYLMDAAEKSLALSMEALLGCTSAYDERLHAARGQVGQIQTAKAVKALLEGSTLAGSTQRVQDAYSLRCAPQVQGVARDTWHFTCSIVEREINAATDNPLIFESGEAISGGNFHGEPIGAVMDFLAIALAEVGAIAERRTFRLTDGKLNEGLPPMLVDSTNAAGLNSGLMMPQYTAASLVLENQSLATPDSVHSLPTSGNQEDHNANATTAARHCRMIMKNVRRILAIELFTASRAVDLRMKMDKNARLGVGTLKVFEAIRKQVPYTADDAWWGPQIDAVEALLWDEII